MSIAHRAEIQDLEDTFSLLTDWGDRYRFVIALGREVEPMDPALKTEDHRVYGCQATVYLVPRVRASQNGKPTIIEFLAEADAAIVNGLIAILRKAYAGRTVDQILEFDLDGLLQRLGLEKNLSPTRRNGLHEMAKRIRTVAHRHAAPSSAA
ncbi:MAG: SufE family protein [Phycisphaeraceae bacterium]